MLAPDVLPSWPGIRDNLWAGFGIMALTAAVSWGGSRYKAAPAFWQWLVFSAMEAFIGLATAFAVVRFGLWVAPWGVAAIIIPAVFLIALDASRKDESRDASKEPPKLHSVLPLPLPEGSPSLTIFELNREIRALPFGLQAPALAGYIGTRVEWDGELHDIIKEGDGRVALELHFGSIGSVSFEGAVAIVEDRPFLATLRRGDKLRIVGEISRSSRPGVIVLNPADYQTRL